MLLFTVSVKKKYKYIQNYIAYSTCNIQEKYTKEKTIYPLCTEVYMY